MKKVVTDKERVMVKIAAQNYESVAIHPNC